MTGWGVLCGAAVLVTLAAVFVWRQPVLALYAFIVGLIVNNTVFLLLYTAGARGWQLTAAQAWKEVLLTVALARVTHDAVVRRALPFRPMWADGVAGLFGLTVVVYALVPQHLLGGAAGPKAELYGVRHYLVPMGAYLVGRSVLLGRTEVQRLAMLTICAAAVAAVAGIVEEYTLSVTQWHRLGASHYYTSQLGFPGLHGPGGLPENFVFNSSDGVHRRLVSFFLSSLGAAYFFVVAIAIAATGIVVESRRLTVLLAATVLTFVGLLFTFTRSALVALPVGLLLLAATSRPRAMLGLALATAAAAVGFAAVFPDLAPRTHFLASDLAYQRKHARETGRLPTGQPLQTTASLSDPSLKSHLAELRGGGRSLLHHPQGYGVGNSGETAARFGVPPRAGESFYLELGADVGVIGMALWLLFTASTLWGLLRVARSHAEEYARRFAAGTLAAGVSIGLIAIISDVWGAPWLSFVLWWFTGSALTLGQRVDG